MKVFAGILVDVSGSMKNILQSNPMSTDETITRAQSIFTIIMNIVNREVNFEDDQNLFVIAFGLDDVPTCDLLALLEYVQSLDLQTHGNGHENLLQLLPSYEVSNAEESIREYMSEKEAQFFYKLYSQNPHRLCPILEQFLFSTVDRRRWGTGQEALVQLLKSNGLSIAEKYVREQLTEKQARFLFKSFSRDQEELQDFIQQFVFSEEERAVLGRGKHALIELLAKNGAPNTKKYVNKYVSNDQAEFLVKFYSRNPTELCKIVNDLPAACKEGFTINSVRNNGFLNTIWNSVQASATQAVLNVDGHGEDREQKATEEQVRLAIERTYDQATAHIAHSVKEHVDRSISAFKRLLRKPVVERLRTMAQPKTKTFRSTAKLLKEVNNTISDSSTPQQRLTTVQVSVLAESIEPFIYGGTPMCEALQHATVMFRSNVSGQKVLFLLSDGESADGDPKRFSKQLREQEVLVFTCFLTSENIAQKRCLHYQADSNWSKAHKDMFELSSIVDNSHPAMSVLLERNWDPDPSGCSRLFIQANHTDVIEEFSDLIHYMSESNTVLMNMIGRVTLDEYINAGNRDFQAKDQGEQEKTCYAYAIATVFHLAMRRITGRTNGVPEFKDLCEELIHELGSESADTEKVLKAYAPKYRLHVEKVNETGARKAISQRRPVVAIFKISEERLKKFKTFYKDQPNGVLERKDLASDNDGNIIEGHAVVLMKCAPESLTFINSWGDTFAHKGFFSVRDQLVLSMRFYDVFWNENELDPSEIEAFRKLSSEKGRNLIEKLPTGIQNLPYKCPLCHVTMEVKLFIIHFSDAECPKCHQHFKPTPTGLNVSAYTH